MTHEYGSWYIAPILDRSNEWAAGYDGNDFASQRDAENEIANLALAIGSSPSKWVAVQRKPPAVRRLWWTSADGKERRDCGILGLYGTPNMEVHSTCAWRDLLQECAGDSERDSVRRGSMAWCKEEPA
jgi:hypothetical protein